MLSIRTAVCLKGACARACVARATGTCVSAPTTTSRRTMGTATGSPPPPSIAPRNDHSADPSLYDQTKEEMRLHYRSYNESEYKLGKHRSNALELIEKVDVIEVEGEMAICDGGGGALGHPLEYISLQRPGVIERCKYCGLRFKSKSWAH